MQFFTSDPIQFQEIIALLSRIKISVCSNEATSEKLAVSYPGFCYHHRMQEGGGGGGVARISVI